jgi:hypothetical protein
MNTSTLEESPSCPLTNKTSTNCKKKTGLRKVPIRKRQNSDLRSIQLSSAKRSRTSKACDSVLKLREPQQFDRMNYLNINNKNSAIYVLPTQPSTKILTNSNISNKIVEMVYYI